MSKHLVFWSMLGAVLADYNPWAPANNTVTKILSRTAYVCPCDGSTSYDPDWNMWESPKTDMSGTTKIDGNSHTWTSATATTVSEGTPSRFSTRCYTTMGADSAPYGTSWFTSYTSCTSTLTATVNATVTLSTTSIVTATETVTSTTTAPTDTLTSTVTETDTATTTTTTTETDTTTTTTTTSTTSTSTIAASSGFVPIQSSLPRSSYAGSGGDPVLKRPLPAHAARVSRNKDSTDLLGFSGHPRGVSCVQWVPSQCSSVTTTVTNTQTQSASTIITTTLTTTSTSTVVPSATATVTTTTTTITTDTATTTTTSTETDTVTSNSTTSVYAACATNNLADTVSGQIIGNAVVASNSDTDSPNRMFTSVGSAYDCCVAALLTSNSEVSAYVPSQGATNNCIFFTASTCPNGQLTTQWQVYAGDQGLGQITLSNLNCGENDSQGN